MNQQQLDQLLEDIAERSYELCSMIEQIQSIEGATPSQQWLQIFEEITRAWFANDTNRLNEITNFIYFGTKIEAGTSLDLRRLLTGPGPLTNH